MMGAPPSMDFPPLMGPFGAEPSQEYINEQLAHMIIPQLDDEFEQVCGAASILSIPRPLQLLRLCQYLTPYLPPAPPVLESMLLLH